MNKTLIILKHEFTQAIKKRWFILMTLSVPLIALVGMSVYQIIQNRDVEPEAPSEESIGYVDATGVFTDYTEQPELTFIPYPNEDRARTDVVAGEIDEYFVIPKDYLVTGEVIRYTSKQELETPYRTRKQMSDFLISNLLADKASNELLQRITNPLILTSLQLDEVGQVSERRDSRIVLMVPYIFGYLFIMSIMATSGSLLESVSEEKENRMIEVLLSSVSVRQLLVGKMLGRGLAGLVQIAVWLATIRVFADVASVNVPALSDLTIPTSMLVLGLLYFILGYLLFAVVYAGLGSIATSAKEAMQSSFLVILPAVVPIMLFMIIAQHPDGILARVLTFIPFTAPTTVMMRLPNASISVWELGLSLAVLLVSIRTGVWLAAKVLRICLLMYGKRPALREIIRYAREG